MTDVRINKMRHYSAAILLLLAVVLSFSQTVFLLNSPASDPMIAGWAQGYRISSSLKAYGFSLALVLCAAITLFRPSKAIYIISTLLMIPVAWQYMAAELWTHFVVLPELSAKANIPIRAYFSFDQPLSTIPRLLLHILIPIGLILQSALLFKNK